MRLAAAIVVIAFVLVSVLSGTLTGQYIISYQSETPVVNIVYPADRQIIYTNSMKIHFNVSGEVAKCTIFDNDDPIIEATDVKTGTDNVYGIDIGDGEHEFMISCIGLNNASGSSEKTLVMVAGSQEPPILEEDLTETPSFDIFEYLQIEDNLYIYIIAAVIWVVLMVVVIKYRPKGHQDERTMQYVPLESQPEQGQPSPKQPDQPEQIQPQPASQPVQPPQPVQPTQVVQPVKPPEIPEPVAPPTTELTVTLEDTEIEKPPETRAGRLLRILHLRKVYTREQKKYDEDAEEIEEQLKLEYLVEEEKVLRDKIKNIILSEVSKEMYRIEKNKARQIQLLNLLNVKIDKALSSIDVTKIAKKEIPMVLKVNELLKKVRPKLAKEWKKILEGL
jgi:hypothetical protein